MASTSTSTSTNLSLSEAKKPNAATAAATGMMAQRPVTGPPAPNSDIIFFINGAFRKEFDVCAQLTTEHAVVTFEADLVKALNQPQTITYTTSLRVPKGCMIRAKVHPIFRRMMVQSMWLQQQPAMLRYKGSEDHIDPKTPVCNCANPPCQKSAVRFVGNPGFFLQKNMLIDPFCIPVCGDTACVLQAQQMSNTIHAQAQKQPQGGAIPNNPALKAQMPNSVKTCNMCGSFEKAYGGTAVMLRGCPLCSIAFYCSQQCQIQDWQRGHKTVCTNANGKTAVKSAASPPKKKPPPPQPATIPEAAPAPAPAPAPIPLPRTAAPAPAPAPIPMPMPAAKKKPPPPPSTADVTQAMSSMKMPTYKVPAEQSASMAVPTYKMPEPPVPTRQTSAPPHAIPAYAATAEENGKRISEPAVLPTYNATGAAAFATPTFAAAMTPIVSAPSTPDTAAAAPSLSSIPIRKGRKKAE